MEMRRSLTVAIAVMMALVVFAGVVFGQQPTGQQTAAAQVPNLTEAQQNALIVQSAKKIGELKRDVAGLKAGSVQGAQGTQTSGAQQGVQTTSLSINEIRNFVDEKQTKEAVELFERQHKLSLQLDLILAGFSADEAVVEVEQYKKAYYTAKGPRGRDKAAADFRTLVVTRIAATRKDGVLTSEELGVRLHDAFGLNSEEALATAFARSDRVEQIGVRASHACEMATAANTELVKIATAILSGETTSNLDVEAVKVAVVTEAKAAAEQAVSSRVEETKAELEDRINQVGDKAQEAWDKADAASIQAADADKKAKLALKEAVTYRSQKDRERFHAFSSWLSEAGVSFAENGITMAELRRRGWTSGVVTVPQLKEELSRAFKKKGINNPRERADDICQGLE